MTDGSFLQIVEELEDRLGEEKMSEVLSLVQSTMSDQPYSAMNDVQIVEGFGQLQYPDPTPSEPDDDDGLLVEEQVFDDVGEGAGIEGDLDKEED